MQFQYILMPRSQPKSALLARFTSYAVVKRKRMLSNIGVAYPILSVRYAELLRKEPVFLGQRYASTIGTTNSMPWFVGFWQSLSQSTPVFCVQETLVTIHDKSGLPWWATILLSTFLFRTLITLPLAIYQQKIAARLENITLEMPALVAELKREAAVAMKKFNWTEKQTRIIYNRSLKKQWNNLIVRENCHPAKTLVVLWGQIPLWICQSVALRNLVQMLPDPNALEAQIIFSELTVGGFGWIPNLTEIDSSFIMPITLGLLNLSIIEIQTMLRRRPLTRFQKITTNVFRMFSVAMVPIACSVPSGLCLYWVTSSTYGLMQNLLLLSPKVRRSFGIPETKSELENPFNYLWVKIKLRTKQMSPESDGRVELKYDASNNLSLPPVKSKNDIK